MLRMLGATFLLLAATAAGAAPPTRVGDLQISGAWARASIGTARPGAAYFSVSNLGADPDALTSVRTPAAAMPMIHATTVAADGVARMEHVPALAIPPGGQVTLEPGGMHLMLMELTAPLTAGATLPVTLVFERAGPVEVEIPVLPIAAKGPPAE